MPSADFCIAITPDCSAVSCSLNTVQISRGKTLNFHRVDAQFIKHIPIADGGLSGHVPAGPEYVTPNIEFLVHRPAILRWTSFRPCLTTTPSPKAPTVGALSLTFGSANTW